MHECFDLHFSNTDFHFGINMDSLSAGAGLPVLTPSRVRHTNAFSSCPDGGTGTPTYQSVLRIQTATHFRRHGGRNVPPDFRLPFA